MRALIVFLAIALAYCKGHLAHWVTPNNLHPVQGLFVKPSGDGATGDLYVAATEDNGVKAQWLTDQPVNFLPLPVAQKAATAFAAPFKHEDIMNPQKRAVISGPANYGYAAPAPIPQDGKAVAPYPYVAPPANPVPTPEGAPKCEGTPAPPNYYPSYYPFQYFYPHMMSAYANAASVLKDAGFNEETANSLVSQSSPTWPYAYPVPYVVVDPAAWAQAQATSPATPAAPANPTTNENA